MLSGGSSNKKDFSFSDAHEEEKISSSEGVEGWATSLFFPASPCLGAKVRGSRCEVRQLRQLSVTQDFLLFHIRHRCEGKSRNFLLRSVPSCCCLRACCRSSWRWQLWRLLRERLRNSESSRSSSRPARPPVAGITASFTGRGQTPKPEADGKSPPSSTPFLDTRIGCVSPRLEPEEVILSEQLHEQGTAYLQSQERAD